MSEVTTTIETITPELAQAWLEQNVHNRRLDRMKVSQYSAAMRQGDWRLNGESIKFDGAAGLLDGQHRLAAVAHSGVTLSAVVVRGLPRETQETVDRGKSRSIADVLQLRGEHNATTLAAALGWMHRFETGTMRSSAHAMTVQDALRLLDRHPLLRSMGSYVEPIRKYRLLEISLSWALAYRFSCLDQEDAADFFRKLASGAGLPEDDPILRLRNALLIQNAGTGRVRRLQPWIISAMVIKAWNLYRDGETARIIKFRSGGARPEEFPVPH